jgi:hypothetical protein
VVWLRVDDELRPEAASDGGPHAGPLPVDGHELPLLPDADLSVPVMQQGELLGAISIRMPKDEPLRPASEQLVADAASQAGLVLANSGLIEDLRASRQRLVTAQDEARRLERNLHDGAQQDLVALGIKLQLADMTVEDPAQTRQILGELKADAAGALENLRDLARGIYPPLLADLGLAAALGAQASKSPLPVTVEADGIGRLGQDTEAAVYFCCLEALQARSGVTHQRSPAGQGRTGRYLPARLTGHRPARPIARSAAWSRSVRLIDPRASTRAALGSAGEQRAGLCQHQRVVIDIHDPRARCQVPQVSAIMPRPGPPLSTPSATSVTDRLCVDGSPRCFRQSCNMTAGSRQR